MNMKKYAPIFLLIIFVPSVAFASWWNPFTWFSAPTPSNSVIQKTDSSIQKPAVTTPIKIAPKQKVVLPKKSVPSTTSPVISPTVTPPPQQTVVPPVTQNIVATPAPNTTLQTQAQEQANQAQARYQAQYQVVQAKIKPLQDQADSDKADAMNPQCGLAGGIQGVSCLASSNAWADLEEYIGAIKNDFITPVTDFSIAYENKFDEIHRQIFEVKMNYHAELSGINSRPGGNTGMAAGQTQNALTAANAKIDALNQQLQWTLSDYQRGIAP